MTEIQLPQGMRDLSGEECRRKEDLRRQIESIFDACGYEELETPAVEFFETFRNAYQDIRAQDMYRFFDHEGRMMVLREDMTVPAARVCASRFANRRPPFRIRYCSDVFKVRNPFAGRRSEVTDCGIECIGIGETGDLEILATAADVMKQIGSDSWSVEIGDVRFFSGACNELKLNEKDTHDLGDLINRKSLPELDEKLAAMDIDSKAADFFRQLPLLGGNAEVLDEAEKICFTPELQETVFRLKKIYADLTEIGRGENITFDFGKAPHLSYYTGIIFDGYVGSVGTSVLSGGRYDNLLARFGRDMPACGFSVKLDYLLDILPVNAERKIWKLYYPAGKEVEAVRRADECRKENPTELIPWNRDYMEVVR